MFTEKISMNCTRSQYEKYLRKPLLEIGYIECGLDWYKNETILVNNMSNSIGCLGSLPLNRKLFHDRKYLGSFDANLFLELASKTDDSEGQYKVGDYITVHTSTGGKIMGILSSENIQRGNDGVRMYTGIPLDGSLFDSEGTIGFQNLDTIRPSTEKEKETLDTKLRDVGKYFDKDKLQVKNIETKMKTVRVTRGDLQRVHEVACPDWKDRIIQMLEKYGDPFSASVTLPEEEVRQMFEAATSDQIKILRKVFPVWEDQGPVRNLSKGEEKRVDELLQELSTLLFGDTDELQLAKGWADHQPELKGKTIGVPNFGVRLHESKVASGVTLIEFTGK